MDDLTLTAARAIHVARGRCSDAAQGRDCTHTSPLGRGEEDDARAVLEAVGLLPNDGEGEPEPDRVADENAAPETDSPSSAYEG